MGFLSGKNNNFRFAFPVPFIPEEIENKYRPILHRIPGNMCETVLDLVNYSIRGIEFEMGLDASELIEQTDRATPQGRYSRSDAVPDMLWNRDITITFQLDSSYLIWHILCEVFMYYYCTKDKYLPKPPGMEILDTFNKVLYRITFDNLLFTSVSGLEFDFSSNEIDQKIITTTWKANKINVIIEPSKNA